MRCLNTFESCTGEISRALEIPERNQIQIGAKITPPRNGCQVKSSANRARDARFGRILIERKARGSVTDIFTLTEVM
jgi:hypothetical protein